MYPFRHQRVFEAAEWPIQSTKEPRMDRITISKGPKQRQIAELGFSTFLVPAVSVFDT